MNLDENKEVESNEIKIKIRTKDNVNNELIIEIKKDSTIKDLKEKIFLVRMIYFFINKYIILYFLEISNSSRKATINI